MVLFQCRPVNLGVLAIFATYVERVDIVKSPFEVVALVTEAMLQQVFEGLNLLLVQHQPVALDFRRMQHDDLFFRFRLCGQFNYRFLGHNELVSRVSEFVIICQMPAASLEWWTRTTESEPLPLERPTASGAYTASSFFASSPSQIGRASCRERLQISVVNGS